ncbi:ATP-grasp domain-containing protein [Corynebacterium sp. A21]|uniref:ATP-grasp domain-containing protein n=1 Tax=Corynebacterium sp. A21 TaxID=3457318 RepID=UPI003FD00917
MNILLSSVGRRPYLVRWFQEALTANGLDGRVIAADLDPLSPARAFTEDFVTAPGVDSPRYQDWLRQLLTEREIDLAISINDFELSEWALLPRTEEWGPLVRLTSETQILVEDKHAMGVELDRLGIRNPATWLGGEIAQLSDSGVNYVTKGRFGSASRGLRYADTAGLKTAIKEATHEVTTRQGLPALDQQETKPENLVIFQEQIVGDEYGLDVVCDLHGRFAGVLARRKISMRSGETDRAESVNSSQFEDIARSIAEAVPHPGTCDVDVIVDADGHAYVIDINPRFGGGYPFSHLAGARIPNVYVAWIADLPVHEEWLRCDPGVIGGKLVEAVMVS